MPDKITQRILGTIRTVAHDRHKLIILLGAFGSGKTKAFKQVEAESDAVYINLNSELSERLLQIPASKLNDGVTVHQIIDDICEEFSQDRKTLLVDNIELLFSPELGKINPVTTFMRASRERVIVLALPAIHDGNLAIYSSPDSQDYLTMLINDYVVIDINEKE